MATCKKLEVQFEDPTKDKWSVPLKDDVFAAFMSTGTPTIHKVFGDGSLFSPLLFGKFFDPSDAFPLWEFESSALLTVLPMSGQSVVEWFQTDANFVLKAQVPAGTEKNGVRVFVENGKIVEISGQWRLQNEPEPRDWRSLQWWEHGHVRRLELPENADWRAIEVYMTDDVLLEIRIPKES